MQLSRFVTATKTCPSNYQRITWTVFRWKWVKLIRSLLDQSLSYWTAEASIPSHAISWQGQLFTAWLNVRVQAEPILANSYTGWRRSWVIFVGGLSQDRLLTRLNWSQFCEKHVAMHLRWKSQHSVKSCDGICPWEDDTHEELHFRVDVSCSD